MTDGLSGAFNAADGALNAQSNAIGSISQNIANVNTVGYKSVNTDFLSQLGNALSTGGVTTVQETNVTDQGQITNTGNATDLALNGNGFFVVNTADDGSGSYLYTRAGSFTENQLGYLVNPGGFFLYGWPLNANGDLPGTPGNTNTTANSLLASTTAVKISQGSGTAQATTTVAFGLNLNASQPVYTGAGATLAVVPADAVNYQQTGPAILIPNAAAGSGMLAAGQTLNISTGSGSNYTYTYGGFATSATVSAGHPILGATTLTTPFTGATSGDAFTITTSSGTTTTLTYEAAGADPAGGTFDNMTTLAQAINDQAGFTARTDGVGTLYISSTNANDGLTFAKVPGSTVDFTSAANLNLAAVAASSNRFNSLSGLQAMVTNDTGLTATVNSPDTNASLTIDAASPLDTVSFTNPATNATTDFLTEFGIAPGAFTVGSATTDGPIGPVYNATGVGGNNMASGLITPQFTKNLQIVDSLGVSHNFTIGFIKSSDNIWQVEVWDADSNDIITSAANDQIAAGTVTFNGDGSLQSVTSGLSNPVKIVWADDAAVSNVSLNFGTAGPISGTVGATQIGLTNGLSQFAGSGTSAADIASGYQSNFVTSNGAQTGQLSGIQITAAGIVVANYSNGQSLNVYQLPIALFNSPDGLQALNGNVFSQTVQSGDFNLKEAGQGGAANVVPDALEGGDVDLSSELTEMLIVQRAYDSSSEVIKTVDAMLDDLKQL